MTEAPPVAPKSDDVMLASVMRCPILSHKGGSGHISSKRLRILSYFECPRIRQKPLSTRLRKLLG